MREKTEILTLRIFEYIFYFGQSLNKKNKKGYGVEMIYQRKSLRCVDGSSFQFKVVFKLLMCNLRLLSTKQK